MALTNAEKQRNYRARQRERLEELHAFAALALAPVQRLTADEYRLVLNCLHPDRAPADRRERFAKAFALVRKLQEADKPPRPRR